MGELPQNSGMVFIWLAVAVVGRIILMPIPSVEPVIPIAILVALSYGLNNGVMVGASGYLLSNIFTGYFGEWNVFLMFAGAVAVLAIYIRPKQLASSLDLVYLTFIGTIIYELVVNVIGGQFDSSMVFDLDYLISSIPFTSMHVISNVVIATVLSGFVQLPQAASSEK